MTGQIMADNNFLRDAFVPQALYLFDLRCGQSCCISGNFMNSR